MIPRFIVQLALVAITLSKGNHKLTLDVPYFAGEREGIMISTTAFIIWIGLAMWGLRSRRNRPINQA